MLILSIALKFIVKYHVMSLGDYVWFSSPPNTVGLMPASSKQ